LQRLVQVLYVSQGNPMNVTKYHIMEILEPSLLLGLLSSFLGLSAAIRYGNANIFIGILSVAGVVLAQASANLIDDYIDYEDGIDRETIKTRFSGGSSLVAKGKVKSMSALFMGLACAVSAATIGAFVALSVPYVIPFIIMGAAIIVLYARYLTRIPFLAEPLVAVEFLFAAVGTFAVAHGSLAGTMHFLPIFVIGSMFGGIALLVNELPDRNVDRKYGRKTACIMLKTNGKMASYFLLWQMAIYAIAIASVASGVASAWFLALFALTPASYLVYRGMKEYRTPGSYERYMSIWAMSSVIFLSLMSAIYLFL
jgi:1,4-dihydroxy-2-naphthoate octaprenyltransferase